MPTRHLLTPLLCAAIAACTSGERRLAESTPPRADSMQPSSADSGAGMHGLALTPPKPKPDFTLTDTEGKPFDLRRDTEGYVTLLFFGYTHCPDVCPVHLANIAAVLHKLPVTTSQRVRMVFVTTDPERDTREVVRAYLDKFDRGFIGLTGTAEAVLAAQAASRIPPAYKEVVDSANPGNYTVGHAAFVFAYTADGMGRFLYPFGVRQADWAHDIPKLVAWPASGS
jgi:protein SCO1/2